MQEERARPTGQKLMANLGAGMSCAWEGAKQLVGQGAGDEAIGEKRRIDEQLAKTVTGGGLTQIAGELLPAVAVGGGIGAAARALPAAVQATRGMQLASRGLCQPCLQGGRRRRRSRCTGSDDGR